MLSGKSVVITGASQGIGRSVALAAAKEGARLILNGSGADGGESLKGLKADIERLGAKPLVSAGDVSDYAYVQSLISRCMDAYGKIDVLINNAGIGEGPYQSVKDIPPEQFNRVVDVHLRGTFNTCRCAVELMVEQRSGAIINTGSHAFLGTYGGSAYAAAKGAIISLSAAMSADLKEHNIRCNVVNPGAKTRLSTGDEFEQSIRDLAARGLLPSERVESALNAGSPDSITALYLWLASDLAADQSGKIFSISARHLGEFEWPSERYASFRQPGEIAGWTVEEIARAYAH